ncbi:MAG: hypothetical protein U9Q07_15860 [Planctomycetota bacterium]|nr:hypothetical protein [Planctomycetota bacterium]
MKKGLLVVGLFVSAVWLGGCVVFVDEKTGGSADATIAEIDAVGKLSFDSERKKGYEKIAMREGLTALAQVHLVEAVLDNLTHDSVKEEVLLTLIANPSFGGAAEREILEQLDRLAFESSKKKVLKAIGLRAGGG